MQAENFFNWCLDLENPCMLFPKHHRRKQKMEHH